jgi:hypothetical protein
VTSRGPILALLPLLAFGCRAYDRAAYARALDAADAMDAADATDAADVRDAADGMDAAACDPARVPQRPAGLQDVDGGTLEGGRRTLTFGLRQLNFGIESRVLWGMHGLDRDGLCTDPTQPDAGGVPCRPRGGGAPVEDGERGRDNAFAARLGIAFAGAGWTDSMANDAIRTGRIGVAVRITGYGGPDDAQVLVEWLPTVHGHRPNDPNAPPAFDGRDVWHVNSTYAYDPGAPGTALVRSNLAFVTRGTIVIALPSRSPLRFRSSRAFMRLTLSGTRIVGPIATDGSSLGPLEFSAIWPLMDARGDVASVGICPPPPADRERTWNFVNGALEAAADLLSTEEVAPSIDCDAISVGFGTEWVPIQLGADEAGPVVNENPCAPDAGRSAATGG